MKLHLSYDWSLQHWLTGGVAYQLNQNSPKFSAIQFCKVQQRLAHFGQGAKYNDNQVKLLFFAKVKLVLYLNMTTMLTFCKFRIWWKGGHFLQLLITCHFQKFNLPTRVNNKAL